MKTLKKYSTYILLAMAVLALIFISVFSLHWLNKTTMTITGGLNELDIIIEDEDWPEAERLLEGLQKDWDKVSPTWHILIDHGEINKVEEPFRKLAYHVMHQDSYNAGESIQIMLYWLEYIRNAEEFNLRNIF